MNSLLMITTIPETLIGFLLPFAQHFRAQGWRVDAMACGISSCAESLQTFNRVWEIEWSRNPLDTRNFLVAPRTIQDIVQQGEYNIVHVHTPVAAFVTRYALKNFKKQIKPQIIYTAHGFHFYSGGKALKNSVFTALEKLAGSWTDYLVVINREDEDAAKRQKLVPCDRICYMPGIGVDLQYYNPNQIADIEVQRVRQELGLSSDTPLVLSVAEFIPRKRPQDVLNAFARLARPDACLAFAGDGLLTQEIKQLAFQLGIQNQVRFLGFRKDIPTLMRAAAVTVLASEQEGLPRSIMESLCLETPVIGTNIRGIRDLVTEDCGVLVNVGDVEGLARAIGYILDRPQEARVMGKRGREHMSTYDLCHVIKLHETLYAKAMLAKT